MRWRELTDRGGVTVCLQGGALVSARADREVTLMACPRDRITGSDGVRRSSRMHRVGMLLLIEGRPNGRLGG